MTTSPKQPPHRGRPKLLDQVRRAIRVRPVEKRCQDRMALPVAGLEVASIRGNGCRGGKGWDGRWVEVWGWNSPRCWAARSACMAR